MLARSTLRSSVRSLRPSMQSRGMAAAVSNPFHYNVSDAQGVKVATRDDGGPTANLALVVKAGSRYETLPGLAHGLSNFVFKSTTNRTALRLTRESELLGSFLSSSLSRENIVLKAKFLRQDLPYFLEALADVAQNTKYTHYVYDEEVKVTLQAQLNAFKKSSEQVALELAHSAAFRRGLGESLYAINEKFLNSRNIGEYAKKAYVKSNIAIVGSGLEHGEVAKWTGEFFGSAATGAALESPATQYFGGQVRVTDGNIPSSYVIAFPGSAGGTQFKPEFKVLAHLLGGKSPVKWSVGDSLLTKAVADVEGAKAVADHISYTDAGLLYITVTGPETSLFKAGENAVKAIQSAANAKAEDVKAAIAQAKFDIYSKAEDKQLGLQDVGQSVITNGAAPQVDAAIKALESVSPETVKKAVQTLLNGKASIGAVGNLRAIPYAEEIGLKA